MTLQDKVIIVTGASSGIGEALARQLAAQGAKVVLAARSEKKLDELSKELPGSFPMKVDMRSDADIKNLIETAAKQFGRIDVLVNNAGQGMYGPVERIDLENYQEIIDLNVFGPLRAMQHVIPQMRKQGEGIILNVSSRVSKNYFPNLAAYASTKYALNALSLTARQELAPDNIVVSVFHPKMTATAFAANAFGSRPDFARRPAADRPMVDSAEEVATQIIEQIKSGVPEAEM